MPPDLSALRLGPAGGPPPSKRGASVGCMQLLPLPFHASCADSQLFVLGGEREASVVCRVAVRGEATEFAYLLEDEHLALASAEDVEVDCCAWEANLLIKQFSIFPHCIMYRDLAAAGESAQEVAVSVSHTGVAMIKVPSAALQRLTLPQLLAELRGAVEREQRRLLEAERPSEAPARAAPAREAMGRFEAALAADVLSGDDQKAVGHLQSVLATLSTGARSGMGVLLVALPRSTGAAAARSERAFTLHFPRLPLSADGISVPCPSLVHEDTLEQEEETVREPYWICVAAPRASPLSELDFFSVRGRDAALAERSHELAVNRHAIHYGQLTEYGEFELGQNLRLLADGGCMLTAGECVRPTRPPLRHATDCRAVPPGTARCRARTHTTAPGSSSPAGCSRSCAGTPPSGPCPKPSPSPKPRSKSCSSGLAVCAGCAWGPCETRTWSSPLCSSSAAPSTPRCGRTSRAPRGARWRQSRPSAPRRRRRTSRPRASRRAASSAGPRPRDCRSPAQTDGRAPAAFQKCSSFSSQNVSYEHVPDEPPVSPSTAEKKKLNSYCETAEASLSRVDW